MRAAWLICRKNLRARLRDRSAVLIGVVVPLGLAFIFNSIFSGISGASVIKLGVVNADHGAVSGSMPADGGGTPDPSWKRLNAVADVLAPKDQELAGVDTNLNKALNRDS